jgi:hypothetical protein
MLNTLLIQILSTFDRTALKRWGTFIASDYYLKNKKTKALGAELLRHPAKWQQNKLSKQDLWHRVYAPEPYHEANFNNYLSDLLEVTYTFIATEEYQEKAAIQYDLTISGLFKRGLHQSAQRILRKWELTQKKTKGCGPSELLSLHKIAEFKDKLNLLESKRRYAETLQQKSNYLDQYYLLQQLMYYCEMLNRGKIIQGSYQLTYLEDLLSRYEKLSEAAKAATPAISMYVNLVRLLLQGNTAYLETVEALLHDYPNALPKEEQRTVYDFLFNFCIQQINTGKPIFYQKIFELYQGLIQQHLLMPEGRLSQWTYANIITTASRLGEWHWADEFLEAHRSFLPKEDEYNAYHYNLAALRYEQKEFDAALQLLHEVEFVDAFYYQAAKTIQLKIYYLLDEFEAGDALIAAARQFINRNQQISSSKKQSYLHFLRLIRSLFQLKLNRKIWKSEKWQQQVNKLNHKLNDKNYPANHKDWLLEMATALTS